MNARVINEILQYKRREAHKKAKAKDRLTVMGVLQWRVIRETEEELVCIMSSTAWRRDVGGMERKKSKLGTDEQTYQSPGEDTEICRDGLNNRECWV